jgi:hypothetical protein
MRSSIRSCGTATLLVSTLGVAMGDTWDSYVPRTIRSVIEANQAEVAVESTYVFTANNFATRANVVYQGQIRPIPPSRLDFIARYLGKARGHPEWVPLYTEEVLCRENGLDYWLPIQSPVLVYFKDEVAAGATVEIFITWIGAQKSGDQVDWLFTINEFQVVAGQEQ